MLLALTTGHKIGLLTVGIIFVLFALTSAMLIPRLRPGFPGRGLPFFVLATIGMFAAMMSAVIVFGRESEEAGAHGEQGTTETTTTTTTPRGAQTIAVDEKEFKITLPGGATKLKAGRYDFQAKNTGKIDHDLVIDGPGVANEKTPVFAPGKTE